MKRPFGLLLAFAMPLNLSFSLQALANPPRLKFKEEETSPCVRKPAVPNTGKRGSADLKKACLELEISTLQAVTNLSNFHTLFYLGPTGFATFYALQEQGQSLESRTAIFSVPPPRDERAHTLHYLSFSAEGSEEEESLTSINTEAREQEPLPQGAKSRLGASFRPEAVQSPPHPGDEGAIDEVEEKTNKVWPLFISSVKEMFRRPLF